MVEFSCKQHESIELGGVTLSVGEIQGDKVHLDLDVPAGASLSNEELLVRARGLAEWAQNEDRLRDEVARDSSRAREGGDWREKHDRLLDKLSDAERENLRLRRALADAESGNLRMIECYEGIVRHRDEDQLVVTYEIDDDLVEQTYRREQFVGGVMPNVGDHVAVHVRVIDIPPGARDGEESPADGPEAADGDDDAGPLSREF